jgi:hypothetical protein
MSIFDPNYAPGMGDPVVSTEIEFWWGRQEGLQYIGGRIDSASTDAGNTPTTTLRRGLIMGQVTSTKKLKPYSATATDGTQVPLGPLIVGQNMLDPRTQTAGDREGLVLVGGGGLKVAQLIGFDETARRFLSKRFIFDDYRDAPQALRGTTAKTADYTVVAADHGGYFETTGAAGAVNFTLPALANVSPGWEATFFNTVNQNLTVTAPAGKLVAFNNAAATSVALSTAGNKIGSGFRIVLNAAGTFYHALPIGAGTVTVA